MTPAKPTPSATVECPACDGRGVVERHRPNTGFWGGAYRLAEVECPACDGTGELDNLSLGDEK